MTNPNYAPAWGGAGTPDDPAFGGQGLGLAGAIIGAGSQVYDTYQRSKDAKREIQARKEEAELAYQRQVEMWHLQNQYNSPAQQMLRFGAAGLSPHLIYGQGNAGNSQGTPNYQPPNLQYRGVSPPYGGAIQSILPTLMSVGTWLQNMRTSEVDIQSKQTNIEKAEQMIGFLSEKYPREISKLDNLLSLYPYQRSMMYSQQEIAQTKSMDLMNAMKMKYGYEGMEQIGGTAKLDYLRKQAETQLKQAQASWTDFNVTNPQGLIQMVLGGVMAMAGMTMRGKSMSNVRRPKITETETIKRVGRTRTTKVERYQKR